jgi:prophage antirepressor-like protein
MTKLAIKLFGYANAQTILTRTHDGKHWYMARDICNLLGISNHSTAVHKKHKVDAYTLNGEEWKKHAEFTGTSKRELLLVNDKGMLKIIMKSNPAITSEIIKRAKQVLAAL